ncbi:resolvase [Clostridium tetani]|nr:resolvase [Clostridium tetani]
MKKSAIYIRVSTHHQIDKDSLPLQKNDLINYSKFILSINDYEIFEDAGYSGKNTDRPAFQEMMNRIRNGEFTHLLVWKIDRISRNLLDFCDMYEEIKKNNCIFVSKNEQFDTSSAMGEAMLKIILVFAELERKLTGERVTSVMLDRATKGLWNGAPVPLGYKWCEETKFPIIDENERLTVEFIYNKYLETESTSAVRNALNAESIKTKRGGAWTTKTISDIIRNPFYKGTYRYNYRESARGKKKDEKEWIIVDDNHSSIINKELWSKCNTIMDENAERNSARFRSNSKTHVFARLLECGECSKNLYAKQDKPNLDGYIPSIYVCSGRYNHLGCEQKTISDKIIGTFILNYVSNIIRLHKTLKLSQLKVGELEKLLLKGKPFENVVGIKNKSLNELYFALTQYTKSDKRIFMPKENKILEIEDDSSVEKLLRERNKFERALSRLEDLFLFDENEMSEKDYILKKNKIKEKLNEINKKMNELNSIKNIGSVYELDFLINSSKNAILFEELTQAKSIDYNNLIKETDRKVIKSFINAIITKIIVKDRNILSVKFKNGLVTEFIYNN